MPPADQSRSQSRSLGLRGLSPSPASTAHCDPCHHPSGDHWLWPSESQEPRNSVTSTGTQGNGQCWPRVQRTQELNEKLMEKEFEETSKQQIKRGTLCWISPPSGGTVSNQTWVSRFFFKLK